MEIECKMILKLAKGNKVQSWVNRFIHNCCVNKEHKIKGELTLNELSDTEKQIIKDAQKEAFSDECLALQKGIKFACPVSYLVCVQDWMRME